jgi:hypothetical protein
LKKTYSTGERSIIFNCTDFRLTFHYFQLCCFM